MKESIIKNKSIEFAMKIIDLYKLLRAENEYVLSKQILKSGTSIGANVSEALAGHSKKDFAHKMNIALKEAMETLYWLELIEHYGIKQDKLLNELKNDNTELSKILTSIIKTTQTNLKITKN